MINISRGLKQVGLPVDFAQTACVSLALSYAMYVSLFDLYVVVIYFVTLMIVIP
jgi:hypothetical protein